jgi:hypothetical protein
MLQSVDLILVAFLARFGRPLSRRIVVHCAPTKRNPTASSTAAILHARADYSMLSPCKEMSKPSRSCSSLTRRPMVTSMAFRMRKLATKPYDTVTATPLS